MVAYVYLLEEEPLKGEVSGPWTKIGYTKNPPEWRLGANLKRGNPRNIFVAAAFEFETEQAALAAEQSAHAAFHLFKHQKEWFRVPWQQVAAWLERSGAQRRGVVTQQGATQIQLP
jgi:hypothetical protein